MTPPNKEIKWYRRTHAWDYSRGASLFITIATAPRRALFGRVEGGRVLLSELGEIVKESLEAMPAYNPGVSLFEHVVMPDHIHFNVHLASGLKEPLKVLGKAIGRFKVFTTKQAKLLGLIGQSPLINTTASHSISSASVDGRAARAASAASADVRAERAAFAASADGRAAPGLLWQQGYHDRLCLTREFIDSTARYIAYNPLKWELMYSADRALAIHEPLNAPCLDAADYWKGVGNVSLLEGKLVSLRISRQVSAPEKVAEVVSRIRAAVEKDYVILSGFISPAEKAVRDMLCAHPQARFIRILPSCVPNARFKPESRYVEAFAEGRYLEIGKGNDEIAFGRGSCLDYNSEIVEMARASESGLALYWKADGPHKL